jgi:hypothetical protein
MGQELVAMSRREVDRLEASRTVVMRPRKRGQAGWDLSPLDHSAGRGFPLTVRAP